MNIRYRVELDEAERAQLTAMLGGGKHAARKLKRAQIVALHLNQRLANKVQFHCRLFATDRLVSRRPRGCV